MNTGAHDARSRYTVVHSLLPAGVLPDYVPFLPHMTTLRRWHGRLESKDAEDAILALAEARNRCTRAYQALRRLVDDLPPQRWDATVREWVSVGSLHHARAHVLLPRA